MRTVFKILVLLSLILPATVHAQDRSAITKFRKLNRPERCWVLMHSFVAKKAWKITREVLNVTDSISKVSTLDGDMNGGQVDAFRHAFWMAMLTKSIGACKAYKLGKAHERANYIDFKKYRLEEGSHPDKAGSDMDLYNNKVGVKIGNENKNVSEKEIQRLVIDAILDGKMKVIKKDTIGNFLDAENKIIPSDSLQGKWENAKCLVNSNK